MSCLCKIGSFAYFIDKFSYYKSAGSKLSIINISGADKSILTIIGNIVDISYNDFKLFQFQIIDIDFNAEQNTYIIFGEELQ